MSATAPPITPARFAAALPALPLSNLYAKAAELRNSIIRLEDSNAQLQSFAEEGDRECADAIRENEEVIARMEERVELLKAEVEGRGFLWDAGEKGNFPNGGKEPGEDVEMVENNEAVSGGEGGDERAAVGINGVTETRTRDTGRGGTLGDEELMRRLRDRMEEDADDGGVHL